MAKKLAFGGKQAKPFGKADDKKPMPRAGMPGMKGKAHSKKGAAKGC